MRRWVSCWNHPDWQVAANPELDPDEIGWKYRWQILTEKGWQDVPNMPAVSLPPDIEIDVIISKNAGTGAKTTDKNPL